MDFYVVLREDAEKQIKDAKVFLKILEKYILKRLDKKVDKIHQKRDLKK